MADQLLDLIKTLDPELELKYNKFYIGLAKNGQPNNFVLFRAKKHVINVEVKLPESAEIDQQLEEAGLDVMDYDKKWGNYRFRLREADIKEHSELLKKLFKRAYEARS